ncbi:MAG: DUF4956 domain-containing protein [Lachnospiraceae bacterium]|nr:DUF4956 domain-containing protein [Lachnospiraceae bacterium]
MFNSIFSSVLSGSSFSGSEFVIITITAFLCGLIIAGAYTVRNRYSKSFVTTLVLLPATVELIIILVNGNLGAGVAVAGAFSLVRFRSAPGRGQEISGIFLAMAAGLAAGMGYAGIALISSLLISGVGLILRLVQFGAENRGVRMLKIAVPENLDFENRFEDTFHKYLKEYSYDEVRTTNMGSLYKLTLSVVMKENVSSREFLDELRTLNGNLDISLGRMIEAQEAL